MSFSRYRFALVALVLATACGSDDSSSDEQACSPRGKSIACTCADGRHGARTCQSSGSFSACSCTGPIGSGGSSEAGAGGGGEAATSGGASGGETQASGGAISSTRGGSPNARHAGTAFGGEPAGGTTGNGAAPGDGGASGEAGAESAGNAGADPGEGGTHGACYVADVAGCRCADDSLSYRACENGAFRACKCGAAGASASGVGGSNGGGASAGASSGTCLPKAEVCDQLDNDCDGVADNGFPCPDSSVRSTAPYLGGVYFQGTLDPGACDQDTLQQFWPTLPTTYFTGFACSGSAFRFRRDGAIFYELAFTGLVRQTNAGGTELQPTPPCNDHVQPDYDFDAQGTLHYRCLDGVVYRGNGQPFAGSVGQLAGVLDDGRVIATRSSQYAVLDPSGRELSRFPPPNFYVGGLSALPRASSVQGDSAYLLFQRTLTPDEVVVYRVDAQSVWRFVRRFRWNGAGTTNLVISDGTVFVRTGDPNTDDREEMVRAYPPDGPARVVWRSHDGPKSRSFGVDPLITGPRMP